MHADEDLEKAMIEHFRKQLDQGVPETGPPKAELFSEAELDAIIEAFFLGHGKEPTEKETLAVVRMVERWKLGTIFTHLAIRGYLVLDLCDGEIYWTLRGGDNDVAARG